MAQPVSNVTIDGNALNTFGFVSFGAFSLSPIGLLTSGFIVSSADQWTAAEVPYNTTWTDCTDCAQTGDF